MKASTMLSHLLLQDNDDKVDVEIDYKTCEMIGGSQLDGNIGVIEGRQPAFMGVYMREAFQKESLLSIYLHCDIRERALRYLLREVGQEAHTIASERLPLLDLSSSNNATERETDTIATYGEYVAKLPLTNIDQVKGLI
jgi:hypothetical protein